MPRATWSLCFLLFSCQAVLGYDQITYTDEAGGTSASGGAGSGQGGSNPTTGGVAGENTGTGGSPQGQGGTEATGAGATGGTGAGATGGTGTAAMGGTGAGATGGTDATGGTSPSGGSGPVGACATGKCPDTQYCDPADGMCRCLPGYTTMGATCSPDLPGDPVSHSQASVCERWAWGHEVTDPSPFKKGAGDCDKGTLSRGGLNDTVRRANMFRWLFGLGPTYDVGQDFQACAVLAAWNPPGGGFNPHTPPPSAKCYTTEGAQGTGSSNLAWGSGSPANAVDQFIQDTGNDTTFGHRRWIMNPSLAPMHVGYWEGGGAYGNAQCLGVFGMSNNGPSPAWLSLPPPGFSPITLVNWDWTFHGPGASNGTLKVSRAGMPLAMQKLPLSQGYGSYETVAYRKTGWSANPGDVIDVEFGFSTPVTFQVKPVSCN